MTLRLSNGLRRSLAAFAPSVTAEDARRIALVFFVTTVLLWALAYLAPSVFPENDIQAWHGTTTRALDVWGHWDSGHYLVIAREGYNVNPPEPNTPWFPLYPYLIALVMPVEEYQFGAALALSLACFFLLLFVLFDLVAPWRGREVALLAVLYISIFPSALYFRAIYTESLFTLLGLLAYRAYVRERYFQCGVFGALAAMTRLPGVMLLPAFGAAAIWQLARGQRRFRASMAFIGLTAAGLGAVMLIQWRAVGDPLAFFHAVSSSAVHNRRLTLPGASLLDDFKFMRLLWDFRTGDNVMPQLVVDDVLVFVGLGGALYFFRRYGVPAGLFTLCLLLPPLMSGRTVGLIRYMLPVFLFPVFFAEVGYRRPWFHTFWVFISSLLLSLYTIWYACWYWAA